MISRFLSVAKMTAMVVKLSFFLLSSSHYDIKQNFERKKVTELNIITTLGMEAHRINMIDIIVIE